jgi:hypothetical protein
MAVDAGWPVTPRKVLVSGWNDPPLVRSMLPPGPLDPEIEAVNDIVARRIANTVATKLDEVSARRLYELLSATLHSTYFAGLNAGARR